MKIQDDLNRFKQIVKNKVKHNLGKYVSSGEMLGQQGGKIIKIPIDQIDLPTFTYGQGSGVGQGDGEPGDPMDGSKKSDKAKAGNEKGEHGQVAEFTPEELAQILQEELRLPDLEDKGEGKLISSKNDYSGVRKVGAEGLKHFRRTYKEALKRSISSGTYDPKDPKIIPIKDDKRYRSATPIEEESINTAAIFIMDVSGSMGEEQKHIVKSQVFWIDLWLRSQYKGIETRFLIHDMQASEVTRDEFFSISTSGGTLISPAYELCYKLIEQEYPFSTWNNFIWHMSDGDNWSGVDSEKCVALLKNNILPNCNRFCYGQIKSDMGSGDLMEVLVRSFTEEDNIRMAQINDRSEILKSIKTYFI